MRAETSEPSKKACSRHGSVAIFLAVLFLTTSLAQAAPPAPNGRPFRVVDRNGALVGYTVTENVVAREINGLWVSFYVHTALGIFDSNAIYVYFTTTDCSGNRYIPHYSTFAEGTRVGPRLWYPADSQTLTPQSVRVVNGAGEEGLCYQASDVTGVYGVAATVNVDGFGLQLPFRATQ